MEECSIERKEQFYENAVKYWSNIPATVDGMLGGFGFISDTDIKASKHLLKQLFKLNVGKEKALDCGSGIGRITKNLLVPLFKEVDMVEQDPHFIESSKIYLENFLHKIGSQYVKGLQNFHPEENIYDVIWCQWVLGHLQDVDFVNFLISCKKGLKENGVIVIKENVSTEKVEMDSKDSSVTRPLWLFLQIFDRASLTVTKKIRQTNFPKGLYSVYMFVLKPANIAEELYLYE